MADLYAEVVTTTARFLYRGFHVELVERTTATYPTTRRRDQQQSDISWIQSSGRRLRQQHQGLEDSWVPAVLKHAEDFQQELR